MNSPSEPRLHRALQELAEVPGPQSLADTALAGAKSMRRRRQALTGLAAIAAVAALTAPFLLKPAAAPSDIAQFAGVPDLGECHHAPMVNPTTKEVAPENWPAYLQTVLAELPSRSDYVVQNTYDLCNWQEAGASNAYTVINLGHLREHGHLTVNLYVYATQRWVPGSCEQLSKVVKDHPDGAPDSTVLSCQDAAGTQPMVYAMQYGGEGADTFTVGASYPDHRAVVIERIGADVISIDELKAVVSSPALAALIPSATEPLPTGSGGPEVIKEGVPYPTGTPDPGALASKQAQANAEATVKP